MHHRRSSCMWLVVLVLTLALSGAVSPKTSPRTENGAHLPADHPVTKASEYMAQLVKERTGGAIEIQVFPAEY